ncbi:hypothetical protein NMY22_g4571 [Coprinellus aureogranulatus]|nr:hypothetical protein NMY22_g4571 [Coprinellus aureogranulatus]
MSTLHTKIRFDICKRAGPGSFPPLAPDGGIDAKDTTSKSGSRQCHSGKVLGSELPPCLAIPPRTSILFASYN